MKKLEEEPETYDSKFTTLTKGVNIKVQNWILENIEKDESLLEIGCGPGILAKKIALTGNKIKAIDKNLDMIKYAINNYPTEKEVDLIYQIGSFENLQEDSERYNTVISTFMLSELNQIEQQIFLRKVWKVIKPDGRLIIAAEFIPSGFWKILFKLKRWWFKKKIHRLRLRGTHIVKHFLKYLNPIGFEITSEKNWMHGSIKALELKKIHINEKNEPGYYWPKTINYKGLKSQIRIYRCIFTGQVDSVPIEPGLYKIGNPTEDSPIIVTANYEYTYIKVMRDLKGLDVWVLCVDSNGINVWCAARGNDFGNKQLINAVNATGIDKISKNNKLILPQLSAGGISIPQLPKNFPFKIIYGPVWSKYLREFLENRPIKKPDSMKLAKFTFSHRVRAGITHTTFLFRKIFLFPLIGLFILLLILNQIDNLWWIGELAMWIVLSNAIIAISFPLSNFTRTFIIKSVFFASLNLIIISVISWIIHNSLIFLLLNAGILFWISYFSTMSFSGYTMATNPREIQNEYPLFRKINITLIVIVIILLGLNIIFFIN
jgi:2-polyprenyl-3-methyl-5-hydroxy-6-metoxy-1,4-benzoquinol methylase